MPVLTSKDRDIVKKEVVENKPEKEVVQKKKTAQRKNRYFCPFALKGKTIVSIIVDGKTKQIDLIDQIFEVKDDIKKEEYATLHNSLIKSGFQNVSKDIHLSEPNVHRNVNWNVPLHGMSEYKLSHPDNGIENKINCVYAVALPDGKKDSTQLEVKNGMVCTDMRDVANILVKQGFSLISQTPKDKK